MTHSGGWNIIKRKAVSRDWGSTITGPEFVVISCSGVVYEKGLVMREREEDIHDHHPL